MTKAQLTKGTCSLAPGEMSSSCPTATGQGALRGQNLDALAAGGIRFGSGLIVAGNLKQQKSLGWNSRYLRY